MDLVIYHNNCNDGFCAAWLLHRKYPDAVFIAANYGEAAPDVTDHDVIIADFSYPRNVMLEMASVACSMKVFDHHKTAQENLKDLVLRKSDGTINGNITFDMSKSGGRLIADWLNVNNWIVDYTEDRDLWRWSLDHSREVNAYLASWPMTFTTWDRLESEAPDVTSGSAIVRYEAKVVANHIKHPTEVYISGVSVPMVNATTLFSDIAGQLSIDRPFGVAWFKRSDGRFQYSLRSQPESINPLSRDVSQIAKALGGGGHKHAAGFELDYLIT